MKKPQMPRNPLFWPRQRDRLRCLWKRMTYCTRHSHQDTWNLGYCMNCGRGSKEGIE